jgi:hypothetical protein
VPSPQRCDRTPDSQGEISGSVRRIIGSSIRGSIGPDVPARLTGVASMARVIGPAAVSVSLEPNMPPVNDSLSVASLGISEFTDVRSGLRPSRRATAT